MIFCCTNNILRKLELSSFYLFFVIQLGRFDFILGGDKMTLYEEVYDQMSELDRFYRFEGYRSFPYFTFEHGGHLTRNDNYIYFSSGMKHHNYYVTRRMKQLISNEVLHGTGLKLSREFLVDKGSYNEILGMVRNYSSTAKLLSIECSVSPMMNELLEDNTVNNHKKGTNDRCVERTDRRIYGGGYGFCDAWLEVFDLLTYFQSYRRITTANMIEFLQLHRRNILNGKICVNPVSFLSDNSSLVVGINPRLYSDFSKYDLMDSLQTIVDDKLFFRDSLFAANPDEEIRRIVQGYNSEREEILEKTHKVYQKRLNDSNNV